MNTLSRRRVLGLGASLPIAALCEALQANANLSDLIELTHAFLVSLRAPVLNPFLAEWPRARTRRVQQPSPLPVVRWLSQLTALAPGTSASVVAELARRAPSLAWRQTYKIPEVSETFLDNYGYTELAGLAGPVASEQLACGFLLLGPFTLYPPHHHEAQEIYVPLAGGAAWQHGNEPWHDQPAGTVILHARNERHAMQTHSQPLLALYLWRSSNLNQKSQLDSAPAT
jgi:Dimethlysulfonioproprionate lyase